MDLLSIRETILLLIMSSLQNQSLSPTSNESCPSIPIPRTSHVLTSSTIRIVPIRIDGNLNRIYRLEVILKFMS